MTDILTPDTATPQDFVDAAQAVAQLEKLYAEATQFLRDHFARAMQDGATLTVNDLWHRLVQSYDLGDRDDALAQIGAQLEALEALGLVRAA